MQIYVLNKGMFEQPIDGMQHDAESQKDGEDVGDEVRGDRNGSNSSIKREEMFHRLGSVEGFCR